MRFGILVSAALVVAGPASATVIEGFVAPDADDNVMLNFSNLLPANGNYTSFNLTWSGGTMTNAYFSGGGWWISRWWELPSGASEPILWGNEYTVGINCGVEAGTSCSDNLVSMTGYSNSITGLSSVPMGPNDCDTVKILNRICYSSYAIAGNLEVNIASTEGVSYRLEFNTAPVPEPANWAMMIAGFALLGCALRAGRKYRLLEAGRGAERQILA